MPQQDLDTLSREEFRRRLDELRRDVADVKRSAEQTLNAVERSQRSADWNWELVWMTYLCLTVLFLIFMIAANLADK